MANDQQQQGQGQDKAAADKAAADKAAADKAAAEKAEAEKAAAAKAAADEATATGRGDDEPSRPLEDVERPPEHQARVQEALNSGHPGQAPTAEEVGIDTAADEQRS